MDSPDDLRTQAEQMLERQSLRKFSDTVADPALRAQAQQLAAGRMSAAEFVRHMERSATAMRGVDRFVKHVVALSPQELDAIRIARERDIEHGDRTGHAAHDARRRVAWAAPNPADRGG